MTDPTADAAKLLPCPLLDDQIRHMVDRFLGWRLPKPWHPDNGISYARPNYTHPPADHDWPTGTNLFDYTQAEAMVRYIVAGLPAGNTHQQPAPPEGEPVAWAVKDFADGWIILASEAEAKRLARGTGARMERLGLAARSRVEDADEWLKSTELYRQWRDMKAKLAEREDKLAQADAVIAGDVSAGELNGPERRKIIRAACKRHAARQQPVKEKL